GVALSTPNSAIVTINGDAAAAAGSLQLASPTYQVGQSGGKVDIAVHRSGGSAGAVSVKYSTNSGGAVAGAAFTATAGTIQWAAGDVASKTFSVPISNAQPFSGTKAFSVSLAGATAGATLGTPQDATVTIAGSGTAPVGILQLSNSSYTISQDAGVLNVT